MVNCLSLHTTVCRRHRARSRTNRMTPTKSRTSKVERSTHKPDAGKPATTLQMRCLPDSPTTKCWNRNYRPHTQFRYNFSDPCILRINRMAGAWDDTVDCTDVIPSTIAAATLILRIFKFSYFKNNGLYVQHGGMVSEFLHCAVLQL